MVDWRTIKKIDAHIHILPDDVHEANPDSEDEWLCTDLCSYRKMMDMLGVEKAVIMPFNDPWLMSMEFTIDAVHKNLYEMKQRYPESFMPLRISTPATPPLNPWKQFTRLSWNMDWMESRFIPTIPVSIWTVHIISRSSHMRRSIKFPLLSILIPIQPMIAVRSIESSIYWSNIRN